MIKIKKKKWALIYLVFILIIINGILINISVNAITYPTVKPYVNDFANTMSSDEIKTLDNYCAKIDKETTYQIVIMTINSTEGDNPISYANHVGQQNGVGQKTTDNGVVVIWVTNDNTGAIAIGRGAETYLNDAKVGEIGRAARHYFDEGKYYEGFEQILSNIEATIYQRDTSVNSTSISIIKSTSKNGLLTAFIIIIIFVVIVYLILSKIGVVPRMGRIGGISIGGGGNSRGGSWGGGSFGGGGSSW